MVIDDSIIQEKESNAKCQVWFKEIMKPVGQDDIPGRFYCVLCIFVCVVYSGT